MNGYSLDRVDQDGYTLGFFDVGRNERPVIRSLDREGPAYRTGMREGDQVVALDGVPVGTLRELQNEMMKVANGIGKEVPVVLERNGEKLKLVIKPERFYKYVIRRS